jgi:hypothetical protein
MTSATVVPAISDVVAEVTQWKADEETRQNAEVVEVDQEVENLRSALTNLQQQLEALAKFREELVQKQTQLASEETRRAYDAIFAALSNKKGRVAQHAEKVSAAHAARAAAIEEAMSADDVAPLVEEFEQFKTAVEPTLDSLPESYRSVMLEHHKSLSEKVQAHRDAAMAIPLELEVEPMSVDVAFAVDSPDGKPELLIAVLPVSEEASAEEQAEGEGDLQSWISNRVVQAIYETIHKFGPSGAEVVSGGHQGLLAIEVDLLGGPHDFSEKLLVELRAVSAGASELQAASVSLVGCEVSADFILPPEEDEE